MLKTNKVANLLDFKVKVTNGDAFTDKVKGGHHKNVQAGFLSASGMVGGCGVMHIYGISSIGSYPLQEVEETFNRLKKELETVSSGYPCGTLIGRLGFNFNEKTKTSTEIYAGCHKVLLNLGFKSVTEYRNEAHPSAKNDWQRLYIYTWEHETKK